MKSSPTELTGRLVEWDLEKGFGFLEVGERRFSLRWREVIDARRPPAVGDSFRFREGHDSEGRAIARQARRRRNVGWLCRLAIWALILGLCLVLPLVAWYHYLAHLPLLDAALVGVNLLTYWAYFIDKRRAELGEWRVPETSLHLLELAGGWPAARIAQRQLRHKCTKPGYQRVFWLIVAAYQVVAIDLMRDWTWARRLFTALDLL